MYPASFLYEVPQSSTITSSFCASNCSWNAATHGLRNEFYIFSEVAFSDASLLLYLLDAGGNPLLSQQESERIERASKADSLPLRISLRNPWALLSTEADPT